jgi:hypothetical protein
MRGSQTHVPGTYGFRGVKVPSHGLSESQHDFFMSSAEKHAGDIASMLPGAMQVVTLAAGILGVIAIGCAVMQEKAEEARGFSDN